MARPATSGDDEVNTTRQLGDLFFYYYSSFLLNHRRIQTRLEREGREPKTNAIAKTIEMFPSPSNRIGPLPIYTRYANRIGPLFYRIGLLFGAGVTGLISSAALLPPPLTSTAAPILCFRSMCRSRAATEALEPGSRSRSGASAAASTAPPSAYASASLNGTSTDPGGRPLRRPLNSATSSSSHAFTSSSSSALSLASVRSSLPEVPGLYPFSEVCAATNNFLFKRLPGAASSAWRCNLRGRDVVVIQKSLRRQREDLAARLAALGRSHHSSLARLLGASSADEYVYLVYEYVHGARLADCLRNARNPGFTPLASWISRVLVAVDVAQGLEYIHHHSSAASGVHNRVTSSDIIVTEPDFRAKICHFGAADLAGEISDPLEEQVGEITPIPSPRRKGQGERQKHIEGTRGYMAPEVISGAPVSRRSDVFSFGIVLLELLSGEEPFKYRYDKERKEFDVVSLIDTARKAMGADDDDDEEDRWGRIRRWMDRRLRDSFPVDAAQKLIRVALRCVETEPAARPEMTWVAGKVSKAFLESKVWAERVRVPTDFSVSMTPR
ncbi:probable serine/threonine-protein kinase PBL18 [Zingiber officinale]|nr:probable serine/threonine-protein kinase PBL18 [Zingiber officinale]